MYIDSHCHINDDLYLNKEDEYVNEALANDVKEMIVVGFDLVSSKKAVEIARKFKEVYAAVGIIPSEVKNMGKNDLKEIEKLLTNPRVVAVGEIGLDYYWDKEDELRYQQIDVFKKQIALANKYNLPVSIHCREACMDTLEILKNHPVHKKGVIHCFSGSKEIAEEYVKLGFAIGVGGTVTFKNAVKIKEVVKYINKDNYVLETDAPYLSPVPHRGEPNHSKYLSFIAREVAALRSSTIEEVLKETNANTKRIFNI